MSLSTGKKGALLSQVRPFVILCNIAHNLIRLHYETAESLIDRAIELNAIGGVYGNNKPTEFMCLLLKLLQIQPEKEILIEYLQAEEFKYVISLFLMECIVTLIVWCERYMRALAAMYVRMTFQAVEVYEILEPLLKDYRKLRLRNMGMFRSPFLLGYLI